MFVDNSNNVVGSIWIYDFYKGRFKSFRGTDLKIWAGFGVVFFVDVEKDAPFIGLRRCADRVMVI